MKKKNAKLAETESVRARSSEAEELELRRLDITREIEKLMTQYANESGETQLKQRKAKVGSAPNDWNKKKGI